MSLGIDIGTTSIKVSIVNGKGTEILLKQSNCEAYILKNDRFAEQDPKLILSTLKSLLSEITVETWKSINIIAVTGQMHGILFWNDGMDCSNLVTWEDQRCDAEMLDETAPYGRLNTGYGLATYLWLKNNDHPWLVDYKFAGTIMDYVVCYLTSEPIPHMDPVNAASWGFFDQFNVNWNVEALEKMDIQVERLPTIATSHTVVGRLNLKPILGSRSEDNEILIDVLIGTGDNPCGFFASTEGCSTSMDFNQQKAFISMGTSAQVGVLVPRESAEQVLSTPSGALEVRPYLYENDFLLISASMNGGNALVSVAESVQSWFKDFGFDLSIDETFEKLNHAAELYLESTDPEIIETTMMEHIVEPIFIQERWDPHGNQIASFNFTGKIPQIGELWLSVVNGLVKNVIDPVGGQFNMNVVCCGSAITKNETVMKYVIESHFGKGNVEIRSSDAACGAALWGLKANSFNKKKD
eukprot:TRINITY_DN122861_c0_g1_i1.p1 TRINITY_DN122861_c0_g1~~TRINITY_DN122861_c0_g1_i1.p1  ORF type:complete len:507 (-),score=81.23 TRINITY_DN122861_c0_g1_i1:156-1559(-)